MRTDADLLSASAGAPELFGVVYRRRVDELLRYFYRRTGDAQVAADLTAETFAVAFRRRHRFKPGSSPGQTWLYGIARIELARFHRQREVELRVVGKLGITVPTLTDTDVERIESMIDAEQHCGDLDEMLAGLPAGERAAVEARVLGEKDYAEVAAEIGTTTGAARVRVHRGLGRLAKGLVS